jgi:hypothetical protein
MAVFGSLLLTGDIKIEPIAGVSFNDTRKGCALKLCRKMILSRQRKTARPKVSRGLLNVMLLLPSRS